MTDSKKIKMILNIGGQRLALTVKADRIDFTKDVEEKANSLYNQMRHKYPAKSDREIFAMVVYQFAAFYYELRKEYDEAKSLADQCLDSINGTDTELTDDFPPEAGSILS